MVAVLAAPASSAMASPPAVDQYTTHLPGAGGNSGLASASAPVAEPGQLPANVRAALARAGANGQLLTLIATAPGLGAPDARSASAGTSAAGGVGTAAGGVGTAAAVEGASAANPSLVTAVADAAGRGPGLALLGVLACIVGAAALARYVRHRRSSL